MRPPISVLDFKLRLSLLAMANMYKIKMNDSNPLVKHSGDLLFRIDSYKKDVRDFYYTVILSGYQCPECAGRLQMVGQSQAECESCGNVLDPTLIFQQSSCCAAGLIRRPAHYVCSRCKRIVASRFLFDERVFDRTYFREMMQASRSRVKRRREEIRRLMILSRSGALDIADEPNLEDVPGLIEALDSFVQADGGYNHDFTWESESPFKMTEYKNHILKIIGWGKQLFSRISQLHDNYRRDRIWRFVTLIFMQQAGEIELTQDENDLWVQKTHHETYQ